MDARSRLWHPDLDRHQLARHTRCQAQEKLKASLDMYLLLGSAGFTFGFDVEQVEVGWGVGEFSIYESCIDIYFR
jgi:hypothetical protein